MGRMSEYPKLEAYREAFEYFEVNNHRLSVPYEKPASTGATWINGPVNPLGSTLRMIHTLCPNGVLALEVWSRGDDSTTDIFLDDNSISMLIEAAIDRA